MYRLFVSEQGNLQSEEFFKTFDEVLDHLKKEDYFSWVNEQESSWGEELTELPNFDNVKTFDELKELLNEYDHSWWIIDIEKIN